MDKNLLSAETINDVLFSITIGEKEPVENYIRTLQKHHSQFRDMSQREMAPLVPLLVALQENAHSYFRQLLQITGLQLLILALKAHHPVFEKLVMLYEEDYVVTIYRQLQDMQDADVDLMHFPSKAFAFPAEIANERRKERALMAIYETAFYFDIPFLPNEHRHPLSYAAKWDDLTLARGYIQAGLRTRFLNFETDGYSVLGEVLKAEKISYELMELCLNHDACADVMLATGQSLYEAAAACGTGMQQLIRSYGGGPATPILRAIHKTINSMTASTVDEESFAFILDEPNCQYYHEYVNGYTLYSARTQRADVFQTAVMVQNKTVLNRLLQRLEIPVTDQQLDGFLRWTEENPEQIGECTPEMLLSF